MTQGDVAHTPMGDNAYYVYILTNRHRTVFYTGMTGALQRRMHEHQ